MSDKPTWQELKSGDVIHLHDGETQTLLEAANARIASLEMQLAISHECYRDVLAELANERNAALEEAIAAMEMAFDVVIDIPTGTNIDGVLEYVRRALKTPPA